MLVVEHSGGGDGTVGPLARFLHVDSSHSGLIITNTRALAGAGSIQKGLIILQKRTEVGLMAPSLSDPCSVEMRESLTKDVSFLLSFKLTEMQRKDLPEYMI